MLIAGRFDFLKILIVFYSGTKQVSVVLCEREESAKCEKCSTNLRIHGKRYTWKHDSYLFLTRTHREKDIEGIVHRRCILLHVEINGHTQVAIVRNTSNRHHRRWPQALTKMYCCRTYEPAAKQAPYNFDDRIGKFDFSSVRRIDLMYNKREQ